MYTWVLSHSELTNQRCHYWLSGPKLTAVTFLSQTTWQASYSQNGSLEKGSAFWIVIWVRKAALQLNWLQWGVWGEQTGQHSSSELCATQARASGCLLGDPRVWPLSPGWIHAGLGSWSAFWPHCDEWFMGSWARQAGLETWSNSDKKQTAGFIKNNLNTNSLSLPELLLCVHARSCVLT